MTHRLRTLFALLVLLLGTAVAVPPAGAHPADFRALLFTKTAAGAFRHASIPAGVAMFQQMATDHGFTLVHSENAAVFNDAELSTYDVVIMFQTSGMVWDTAAQRTAMQNYVRGGGGVVAIHNATDMNIESQFPWWDEVVMAGSHMTAHSAILPGRAKVADRVHPSTAGLPERWQRTEEWYNFDKNSRGNVHVLVTADETTYDAGPSKMGHDHPISWCRVAEGGRVWATAMGHETASYAEAFFKQHLTGGVEWAAGAAEGDCGGTVWNKFQKVTLDSAPDQPMQLDVAPDGRVFYIQRTGALKVISTSGAIATAGSLNVYTGGEDGLVGIVLDPAFATNGHLYLTYSPAGTAEINRVSRFTMSGNTLDLASERRLLDIPAYRGSDEPGHTGGALAFGPGGNLYIGVGDDVNPNGSNGYAPTDERSGRRKYDAQGSSANTNDLRGKMLRIHPEANGTYTIPAGNMFAPGTALTRPEIYAMGFRNPFRFGVDPVTGWISLADYGPDAGQADPNRGPEGTVEWNLVKQPGNYGWPYCVGNNTPFNDYDFATSTSGPKFNCGAPVNNSPNNTGLTNLPASRAATVWYTYSDTPEWPEMSGGGRGAGPMGGPFYRYDASNPSTTKFPAYYDKTPFFHEWSRDYLAEMRLDAAGNLLKVSKTHSAIPFSSPMHLKFGPNGSLYVIEWGSGFGGGNTDDGVYRIDYVSGNRAPVAKAAATPTSGRAPLAVQFSAAGSSDPDGDALTYGWDFDGNGTTDATTATASHTYTANGTYNAVLTVTDAGGKEGRAQVTITVGNTAPVVRFSGPPDGGQFAWGDPINYTVSVTDPEDGTIDCTRVSVVTAIGHDDHSHDTGRFTGCTATVSTESDHGEYANTFYVLTATYTDSGGLVGSTSVVLQPKRKQAEYYTGSSGVRVIDQAAAENGKRIGDISPGDWVSFKPMSIQGINAVSYRVSSPYGGGTIELRAGSPTGQLVATTSVPNTGGWDTYQSLPATLVSALPGSHELFLVFRSAQPNRFDLDSVTFIGPGVGGGGAAGPVDGRTYTLTAVHSGLLADVSGASQASGARVVQWPATGGTNQRWTARDAGGGTFTLVAGHSGQCLSSGTTNGAPVVQSPCGTQRWRFEAVNGAWRMVYVGTNRCADVSGASTANGAAIVQWTCGGGTNQQWRLTPVT